MTSKGVRWALGAAMLLVIAACSSGASKSSGTSPSTTNATTTIAAPPVYLDLGTWHWDSPEQMGSAGLEATAVREAESLLILFPTDGPAGGQITSGDVRIIKTDPIGEVTAKVAAMVDLDVDTLATWIESWRSIRR